jgi:hypothetical protein
MKTRFIWLYTLIFFLAFSTSATVAIDKSSCITCHTNDAALKALYKPPAGAHTEGEG